MQTFFLSFLFDPPGPSSLILSSGLVVFHLFPLTMLQPASRLAVTPLHVIFCSCEHKYGISVCFPTILRSFSEQLQTKHLQISSLVCIWFDLQNHSVHKYRPENQGLIWALVQKWQHPVTPFGFLGLWCAGVCSVQAGNLRGHPNLC